MHRLKEKHKLVYKKNQVQVYRNNNLINLRTQRHFINY